MRCMIDGVKGKPSLREFESDDFASIEVLQEGERLPGRGNVSIGQRNNFNLWQGGSLIMNEVHELTRNVGKTQAQPLCFRKVAVVL